MREEIIVGGFGGQGVLLLGEIIARAAMLDGKETVCVPAYGPEVRGGFAHSSIIISDRQIGAVTVSHPDTLVIMNQTSLERFLPLLRAGGWLLLNSSLVEAPDLNREQGSGNRGQGAGSRGEGTGDEVILVALPATEMAEEIGNIRVANSIMLGAYVGAKGVLSQGACLGAFESGLRGRARSLAEINKLAFEKGFAVSRKPVRG